MSLLPHEELSVPLQVPPTDFLACLSPELVASRASVLFRNGFVGRASQSEVRIRWARRFVSNDLAPEFRGAVTADQRFVRGTFRQRGWVLAIMIASAALAIGAMVLALQGGDNTIGRRWFYAVPVALVAAAVVLPRLGWAMARADVERIGNLLRSAARGERPRAAAR